MVYMLPVGNALRVQTPYDASFVQAIKSLPASERKFDPATKAWMVDAKHGPQVAGWLQQYFGVRVAVPQVATIQKMETVILEARYIGTTKERGDGSPSAFGWCNGEWSIILPESVLKAWFLEPENAPKEARTLYNVLGIGETEADLRTPYRRLAKQWHPDVCREPDAAEQFKAIQHAYEILSDPRMRAKYDAGLKLERSLPGKVKAKNFQNLDVTGYRAPLRCGLIMAEAVTSLGRWKITKILQWEDITDSAGRTLVTSWPAGAKTFTETWI